jgi:hypothetical protein
MYYIRFFTALFNKNDLFEKWRRSGMKPIGQSVKMGLIVCQHCGRWIDEVETEKVTVIYGCCQEESCRNGIRQGDADDE